MKKSIYLGIILCSIVSMVEISSAYQPELEYAISYDNPHAPSQSKSSLRNLLADKSVFLDNNIVHLCNRLEFDKVVIECIQETKNRQYTDLAGINDCYALFKPQETGVVSIEKERKKLSCLNKLSFIPIEKRVVIPSIGGFNNLLIKINDIISENLKGYPCDEAINKLEEIQLKLKQLPQIKIPHSELDITDLVNKTIDSMRGDDRKLCENTINHPIHDIRWYFLTLRQSGIL